MDSEQQEKLRQFLDWLQVNRVELRGCSIKCVGTKGLGVISSDIPSPPHNERVQLVVPLDLAITPMLVLQDPFVGPECRAMFEVGQVDDRLLIVLFLLLERLRKHSAWRPYIDMLPKTFGTPLWFTDGELLELKGTALYQAAQLQKKQLRSLFNEKVECMLKKLLAKDGASKSEVYFEEFLWANSVFWTRAMNIPLPHSYVFPSNVDNNDNLAKDLNHGNIEKGDTVWVEGIIPGIDFCNHDVLARSTWEIDLTGSTSGVPFTMHILSAEEQPRTTEREISISYGKKGNEELLYLYGFVIEDNPDDFLMIHYPVEALQNVTFSDSKMEILEAQNGELRHLLPKTLLDHGFFPRGIKQNNERNNKKADGFSWSGHRKAPPYLDKLVFPEELMSMLRTISMQEGQIYQFSSLLDELTQSGKRQATEAEVRAAVWEACGDAGALQLLVDLLQKKLTDLEEGTGREEDDTALLRKFFDGRSSGDGDRDVDGDGDGCGDGCGVEMKGRSRNWWSSVVYRRGQKQLAKAFLKEAEHASLLASSHRN